METSLELYHHGVKGQHWGTRNGPPYPLYRKSAYYKKTGKRPPGYTGDKKGKSDSGGSNKSGKIGGVKDYLLANSAFDKSATGRESYREFLKAQAKSAAGIGIGSGVGAGIGAGIAALRKGNVKAGAVYGGLAGSALGSLAGTKSYTKSLKTGHKRYKEIREADRAKKGKIGGYNDDDKRSATKKKILKGVGIAAGTAALAGAGYLAYKNRAAIGSRAGKLRDDIRYKLGELPGTAKLNQTRIDLKNKILGVGKKAKGLVNEVRTPTSALRNDIRLIGASAKGAAKNVGNTARNAGAKVRDVAAKPSQTVYNKITGKSKAALNVAKTESQAARNGSRTLKNFIDNNAKSIEKTTIAKRQALAKIRRGEGNLKELNQTANNLAAREKALIAKQNTAKALAPRAAADRVSKAEAVRQAQEVFNKRNKLGRIAAGATNAGIGLGLAGAAGGAGYGISKLARSGKKKNQNRGTIGGLTKRMTASSSDSAVTRRAKAAYNSMSDTEFRRKYGVSKETYAKRVEKYGDPYMNSPLAKLGKRLSKRRRRR